MTARQVTRRIWLEARNFSIAIAPTFIITLGLSLLSFLVMALLQGHAPGIVRRFPLAHIGFKTIEVLLPMQLFASGIVLLLLATPRLATRYKGFRKCVLYPLARYVASASAVAIAVIIALGVALIFANANKIVSLIWPLVALLALISFSLAVPWVGDPEVLEARTVKLRLFWGIFFLASAVWLFIVTYKQPQSSSQCSHIASVANNSVNRTPKPLRGFVAGYFKR